MKNIFMSFLISILSALMFSYTAFADGHSKGITIVLVEQPDIVDPCEATRSNVGKVIKQNVVETLVEINPADGSIKPRLATSWKQTDNLTWEFKIRTGVKFHDGESLNAKTAVKSIKRSLDPRSDCEVRTKYFGNMNLSVSAKGNDTIVVKTKKPQPIMPALMGTMTISSPNTQELKGERNPQGTGPYTFAEWTPGQKVVLKRNKNYW